MLAVLLTSLLIWIPFWTKITLPGWGMDFSEGTKILWKNFDGPNYLIVEKTWYNFEKIRLAFSNPLPVEYYPAHFPLYPATIWVLNLFFKGPTAMLLSTLLGSILCFLMFYQYVREFKLSKNSFWLTLVFLIFPARWLALRTIGSPEPWFVFFILASLYNFKKENYWKAAICAVAAQLTKSPGLLLAAAYGIDAIVKSIQEKEIQWKYSPLLLQIVSVLCLFWFYMWRTGDFWAYFHSGDNIHLFWPPFSIFSPKGQYWVGNFWLEDVIMSWTIYGIAVSKLLRKKLRIEFYFSGLFFLSTLFVAHRDISRYIMPIAPFALIAWDKLIQKREFKIIFWLLVVPILLFSWNFLLNNTAPVADWAPYL